MVALLCRNRVQDFATWKKVFDSHAGVHRAAGLHLKTLWRGLEQPNDIFFLFEVTDLAKARAFIDAPEGAEAGRASGVLEGDYHFIEGGLGY